METALSPQHRDLSLRPWARLPLWVQGRQGPREEKVAAGTLTFTVEGWRLAFWPQLSMCLVCQEDHLWEAGTDFPQEGKAMLGGDPLSDISSHVCSPCLKSLASRRTPERRTELAACLKASLSSLALPTHVWL